MCPLNVKTSSYDPWQTKQDTINNKNMLYATFSNDDRPNFYFDKKYHVVFTELLLASRS